jgi:putative alpha-1,2-mannosidase
MHFSEYPNGIPGNDDLGTMSSFVLFSSLGFFPQAGTTRFLIGSPRINGGTVQIKPLGGEATPMVLKFIVYANSPENVYIARLLIDGVEITKPFVDRSELLGDGTSKQKTIEFYMSAAPRSGLCSAY